MNFSALNACEECKGSLDVICKDKKFETKVISEEGNEVIVGCKAFKKEYDDSNRYNVEGYRNKNTVKNLQLKCDTIEHYKSYCKGIKASDGCMVECSKITAPPRITTQPPRIPTTTGIT